LFIYQLLGVALMHFVWKNIYCKQLIPGEGSVKERLKKVWRDLKDDVRKNRRKK
jgi:hypothetical protein